MRTPKKFKIHNRYENGQNYGPEIVFASSGKRMYKIKRFSAGNIQYRSFYVTPEYQEWFIENYPGYLKSIVNLSSTARAKYSHLMMIDKFGLFNNE